MTAIGRKEAKKLSSELSASWVAGAELALNQLKDVQAASITTDGDIIREVHVVAVSSRTPKQIVRDVETVLKAFGKRDIDHRVISVALQQPGPGSTVVRPMRPQLVEGGSPAPVPAQTSAAQVVSMPVRPHGGGAGPVAGSPGGGAFPDPGGAPTGRPVPNGPAPRRPEDVPRVRFVTANLFVSGLRTQAQVELSWQGATRLGNATGASARDNAHRLLSSATLSALVPFLGDEVSLVPHEVEFVRIGRLEVVVVTVKLLAQRSEKTLVGSCTVEQDVAQSVVYATLAAVNRVLGGLKPREPVDYELRPTST